MHINAFIFTMVLHTRRQICANDRLLYIHNNITIMYGIRAPIIPSRANIVDEHIKLLLRCVTRTPLMQRVRMDILYYTIHKK